MVTIKLQGLRLKRDLAVLIKADAARRAGERKTKRERWKRGPRSREAETHKRPKLNELPS